MLRDHLLQRLVIAQHVRFEPQLRAHIGARTAMGAQRIQETAGEIGAAQPAFPAPELRQHRRGDAVGGQLGLDRGQPGAQVFHRAAARRQVALEPVAVDIDDARQNRAAGQVQHRARGRVDDHAIGHGHRPITHRTVPQRPRAAQRQGYRAHGRCPIYSTAWVSVISGAKPPSSRKCITCAITSGLFIMKVWVTGSTR